MTIESMYVNLVFEFKKCQIKENKAINMVRVRQSEDQD